MKKWHNVSVHDTRFCISGTQFRKLLVKTKYADWCPYILIDLIEGNAPQKSRRLVQNKVGAKFNESFLAPFNVSMPFRIW